MDGRDRGLQRVGAGTASADRAVEQSLAFSDLVPIPAAAVLLVEECRLAVGSNARLAPRVVEEEQRQEAGNFGLVGHQLGEEPAEADRLVAEVVANQVVATRRGVALIEDEVYDRENGIQALRQLVRRR